MSMLMVAGGLIGAAMEDPPESIDVDIEGEMRDPVSEEVSNILLENFQRQYAQIEDKSWIMDVLGLIDDTKLGERGAIIKTRMVADAQKAIAETEAQMQVQAFGKNIDELNLTPEQEASLRSRVEASVRAIANIRKKEAESGAIRISREISLGKLAQDYKSAGLIADFKSRDELAFHRALNQAVKMFQGARGTSLELSLRQQRANVGLGIDTAATKQQFGLGALMAGGQITGDVMAERGSRDFYSDLFSGDKTTPVTSSESYPPYP